eukprot:155831_1
MNELEQHNLMKWRIKVRKETDNKNLIKKETFDVFKNINNMVVISTDDTGYFFHTFSLSGLLGILEKTSLEKVIVKAVVDEISYKKDSWLGLLWKASSSKIEKQYEQKNYNIGYKRVDGKDGDREDWLEIVLK